MKKWDRVNSQVQNQPNEYVYKKVHIRGHDQVWNRVIDWAFVQVWHQVWVQVQNNILGQMKDDGK